MIVNYVKRVMKEVLFRKPMRKREQKAKEYFVSIGSPLLSQENQYEIIFDGGYLHLSKILSQNVPDKIPTELLNHLITVNHENVVNELIRREYLNTLMRNPNDGSDNWVLISEGNSNFTFIDREHGIDHVKFISSDKVIYEYLGYVFLQKVPKYEEECLSQMQRIAEEHKW